MENMIKTHLNNLDAKLTTELYRLLYQQSIDNPELFWAEQAKKYINWIHPWSEVLTGSFNDNNVRWFSGGKLNVCYNCLDRHLPQRANKTAILWEGDDPKQTKTITYAQLHQQVCQLANGLKALGLTKGDRVCIYLPMIPEAAIAMLACARIGLVHSVVFAGFSAEALKTRIQDAQCKLIITADFNQRGGKITALKANVDTILAECPTIKHTIVVKHVGNNIGWNKNDIWFHDVLKSASSDCPIETMDANDPLFILYTSGSTGKPKGILHGQAGYLLYVTMTFQYIFNYQENDIYWCTADVGWITGHSYIVYGPLASGATTLMFAGVPNYPTPARCWEVVDKHKINIFYTAPTAIRALMRAGDEYVTASKRTSLRVLGTVGEPINPDVWLWYYNVVGEQRCPIVDTWWQTETGGIMISPLPYATPLKPGSASWPFFGIKPAIVNDQGEEINNHSEGNLVITQPWPGQLQTIFGDHQRFIKTYFSQYSGLYCTGDAASCDSQGYYIIAGRTDDVINVSGHRLGTAEIESALVAHDKVTEAAVVSFPHEIKGSGIFAFVTLKKDVTPNQALAAELIKFVSDKISPIAKPEKIQWAEDLPKTRSGKIMRRILRKIVNNDIENLGDISTLANPEVVDVIIKDFAT